MTQQAQDPQRKSRGQRPESWLRLMQIVLEASGAIAMWFVAYSAGAPWLAWAFAVVTAVHIVALAVLLIRGRQ